jgi:hypothetical protein
MGSLVTKLTPKRRWVQVSLRTVLVLVTVLCVALSLWVVPAERQRRAVAAIRALGGNISYGKEVASDTFLRRWLQAYLLEVKIVDLDATQVTDAGLVHLQGLTSLRELRLARTQVTNGGVTRLRQALPNCQIAGP